MIVFITFDTHFIIFSYLLTILSKIGWEIYAGGHLKGVSKNLKCTFHPIFIIVYDFEQNWLGNLRRRPSKRRLKNLNKCTQGGGLGFCLHSSRRVQYLTPFHKCFSNGVVIESSSNSLKIFCTCSAALTSMPAV